VGPDDGAVDGEQLEVDLAGVHLPCLQVLQNALPQAAARPAAEAVIDRLPRAEALGDVAPTAAVGEHPQDGVDHPPVVLPLAAALAVGWQKVLDLGPLFIGKLVRRRSNDHEPLPGNKTWIPCSACTIMPSDSPDRT